MGASIRKPTILSVAALLLTVGWAAVPAAAVPPTADFTMSPDPFSTTVTTSDTMTATSTSFTCVDDGSCPGGSEQIVEERWRVFFMVDPTPDDVGPDTGPVNLLDITFTGAGVPGSSITLGPLGSGADVEFPDDGEYRIRLDVKDEDGETHFIRSNDMSGGDDFLIHNTRPEAAFSLSSADSPITSLSTVDLDGSASSDADGNVVQWEWRLRLIEDPTPDGDTDTPGILWTVTDNDPFYSFSPPDDGKYRVILVVTDDDGGIRGTGQTLIVENVAPNAPHFDIDPTPRYYQAGDNVRFMHVLDPTEPDDPDGEITSIEFGSQTLGVFYTGVSGDHYVRDFDQELCEEEVWLTIYDGEGGSATTNRTISVDANNPWTDVTVPPTDGNGWYHSDPTFDMLALDSCSGVEASTVRLDGEESYYQEPEYSVTVEGDGTHDLKVSARDGAGNWEGFQTFIVQIDSTAPEVSLDNPCLLSPICMLLGGAFFSGDEVPINVSASDDVSGIDKVEVYVDGALHDTLTSQPYDSSWTAAGTGPHTIEVMAYNGAQLTSSASTNILVV